MNFKHIAIISAMLLPAMLPGQAWSADANTGSSTTSGKKRMFQYTPPKLGAPSSRVGGGTRGTSTTAKVLVLAPDHTGLTTQESPNLYWYISKASDAPLEITIVDDNDINPVLELSTKAPNKAGIHSISLSQHGVKLKKDIEYRWYVALIPDAKHRSNDIIAGGTIMRVDENKLGIKIPNVGTAADKLSAYARNGVWYDAIDVISTEIDKTGSSDMKQTRADLLSQVGLGDIK